MNQQVKAVEIKGVALENFKNKLSNDLFNMTKAEAHRASVCINCKQPAMNYCFCDADVREYKISGLCSKCFDQICGGGE